MKVLSTVALLTFVVGCSVTEKPFTISDRQQRVSADLSAMFDGQEPIDGPITIGEAIARALSYNLDHRLKQMEAAVAVKQYDFSKYGMLPRLVARAGYSERSNDPGARSIDLATGEESLPPSSSQERETDTSNLVLTWNILDFGLSYYTAKQNSNQIYIAEERRRKTIQNISQDVVDAFWKAWMSQTLEPKIEALLAETRNALEKSRSLVERGIQNSNDGLRTQGAMLNTINTLIEMRERINLSKTRLAALINVPPGSDYQIAVPTSLDIPSTIHQSLDSLTKLALLNRPEVNEESYRKRISELDVKKTFLKLFPNVSLTAGYYRDENTFLVNNNWNVVGWDITWNLLGIFQANSEKKFNKAQVDLSDARRLSLSLAVITQVYLSASRYELARARYAAASGLYKVRSSLARNSAAQGSRVSGMQELEARSASIASELRRNLAFAETQAAFARVINSLGIDPLPTTVKSYDLKVLSEAFDKRWSSMAKGVLSDF